MSGAQSRNADEERDGAGSGLSVTTDNGSDDEGVHLDVSQRQLIALTCMPAIVTMVIKDYPTTTDDASVALHDLQSTHTIQLMQARDMDRKLIMPADYTESLHGTCTWVH